MRINAIFPIFSLAALVSCGAAPRAVSSDKVIDLGEGACMETRIPFEESGSRTIALKSDAPLAISLHASVRADVWKDTVELSVISPQGTELCSACLACDTVTECGNLDLRGFASLTVVIAGRGSFPAGLEVTLSSND